MSALACAPAWAGDETTSACPRPPINPTESESESKGGGGSVRVGGFGVGGNGSVESTTTYAGTGLSQEAADEAWKLYQLCVQAEQGLIPKDVYVEALRSFYGFGPAAPAATPAPAPSLPNVRIPATPAETETPPLAAPPTQTPQQVRVIEKVESDSVETGQRVVITRNPEVDPAPAPETPGEGDMEPVTAAAVEAPPGCSPVEAAGEIHARMAGTIGVSEGLAWQRSAKVGWLWSNRNMGLGSQYVRIHQDGRLDIPGALNLGAAVQNLSTMDPNSWIYRAVEGTVWGGTLLEIHGWHLIGDQGLVGAQKEGLLVDLAPSFGGVAPAQIYQLPVLSGDGARMLALSIDEGVNIKDTLVRTWWIDGTCLDQLAAH